MKLRGVDGIKVLNMGVEKEKQEKLTVIYARCSTEKEEDTNGRT